MPPSDPSPRDRREYALPERRGRVLVLDADLVPALTIARSLARRGLTVEVASAIERPLAGASRYAERVLRYPDPLTAEGDFLDWVGERLAGGTYDLTIPATERSLVPLHRHRDRLAGGRVALPPAESLERVLDKSRTLALAAELGIRIPRGVRADTVERAVAAAAAIGWPVVVKPVSSIGGTGTARVHLSVAYAANERELRERAAAALRHGEVLIQELFAGEGVGIELIADRGEIRFAFEHLRLHEVPLTGGGSSLRQSVALDPGLLDIAARLMGALDWHGVAMVELKRNPETGEACLMEINGRFWGSLPLALAAGADFPAMLYELEVLGGIAPRPPARTGIYCRNLARDLYWLELVLRREAPPGIARVPDWREAVRDGLLCFSPRHRLDVQEWRDWRPGVLDLGRILGGYLGRVGGLLAHRRAIARARAAWRPPAMDRRLAAGGRLLFLCYGNINRSAAAETLARQRLPGRFAIASAGLHPQAGRPADPTMVEVAAGRGVDLSPSRSRRLDAELVAGADLILAMELVHLERLAERFPEAAGKSFLLGPAAPAAVPGVEIADPYGQPREVYERCFSQLERCIDALAELAGPRP
jgi:protein-tyrosine-phosphatase/predicted ATP-grasp superfamily ATP-dependent carboligase